MLTIEPGNREPKRQRRRDAIALTVWLAFVVVLVGVLVVQLVR